MPLKLYNTLTRKKEEFKPIEEGKIGIYTCGLTVYNYGHIGNYRSFLFEDLLIRYLDYKGYKVTHVMNITDVDDKTIKNSIREGKSLQEYTKKYTDAFFEDVSTLNMRKAEHYPKATEHVEQMIEMISSMIEKKYAYKTNDGSVYFDISKMKDYGKLSKLDLSQLKIGASGRVSQDEYERENISDFVLWKGYTEQDGDVYWDAPFSKGRPGWHLECSAMGIHYLGETFDIHCGGIDNMFPHHENEIAQSEAYTGKNFVNYWLHGEHLIFKSSSNEEEKMSKSLGNVLYIRDLLNNGYDGKTIRFALISAHYKQQLIYSEDRLKEYDARLKRYNDFIKRLRHVIDNDNKSNDLQENIGKVVDSGLLNFEKHLDDDLNISPALASIDEVVTYVNKNFQNINGKSAEYVIDFLKRIDLVIGVLSFEIELLDKDIEQLIKDREEARKNKNYAKADEIRNKLKEKGIILEDTSKGTTWKKE